MQVLSGVEGSGDSGPQWRARGFSSRLSGHSNTTCELRTLSIAATDYVVKLESDAVSEFIDYSFEQTKVHPFSRLFTIYSLTEVINF